MQHSPSSIAQPAARRPFTVPTGGRSFAPPRQQLDRVAVARVLQSVVGAAADPHTEDDCFEAAVALYEFERWDKAFADLALLADEGHPRAAKLALLMLRYGASVYGMRFIAPPGKVARWAQRVLRAASRPTASPSSITAIA